MARYLVTGAGGFIGSAVALRLVERGDDVVTIDNFTTGHRNNVPPGVDVIEGACQDSSVLDAAFVEPLAGILHIAGQSSGEASFDNPVYDLQTNGQSALMLLDRARTERTPRLVYASTMSVYGDQPDAPVCEEAAIRPRSFYAVGKAASEHYINIYRDLGVDAVGLRLFNVYGPGQNLKNLRQGMISIYLAQALETGRIVVKGSPERYRDFVYIDDVVDAFLAMIDGPRAMKPVYNVCTGTRTTVEDVLKKLTAILEGTTSVEFADSTPGDQWGIFGDAMRIRKEFGWAPKVALDDGMKRMVQWAKERSPIQGGGIR